MKKVTIELNIFEKGDFVRTPQGVGKVKKNQDIPKTIDDILSGTVSVRLKSERQKEDWWPQACISITKKEYDEEK